VGVDCFDNFLRDGKDSKWICIRIFPGFFFCKIHFFFYGVKDRLIWPCCQPFWLANFRYWLRGTMWTIDILVSPCWPFYHWSTVEVSPSWTVSKILKTDLVIAQLAVTHEDKVMILKKHEDKVISYPILKTKLGTSYMCAQETITHINTKHIALLHHEC